MNFIMAYFLTGAFVFLNFLIGLFMTCITAGGLYWILIAIVTLYIVSAMAKVSEFFEFYFSELKKE